MLIQYYPFFQSIMINKNYFSSVKNRSCLMNNPMMIGTNDNLWSRHPIKQNPVSTALFFYHFSRKISSRFFWNSSSVIRPSSFSLFSFLSLVSKSPLTDIDCAICKKLILNSLTLFPLTL